MYLIFSLSIACVRRQADRVTRLPSLPTIAPRSGSNSAATASRNAVEAEENRWYSIYRILFPQVPEDALPTPYYDGVNMDGRLDEFVTFIQRDPQYVVFLADACIKISRQWFGEENLRKMIEDGLRSVNEQSLKRILVMFRARRGYVTTISNHSSGMGNRSGDNSPGPTERGTIGHLESQVLPLGPSSLTAVENATSWRDSGGIQPSGTDSGAHISERASMHMPFGATTNFPSPSQTNFKASGLSMTSSVRPNARLAGIRMSSSLAAARFTDVHDPNTFISSAQDLDDPFGTRRPLNSRWIQELVQPTSHLCPPGTIESGGSANTFNTINLSSPTTAEASQSQANNPNFEPSHIEFDFLGSSQWDLDEKDDYVPLQRDSI